MFPYFDWLQSRVSSRYCRTVYMDQSGCRVEEDCVHSVELCAVDSVTVSKVRPRVLTVRRVKMT